MAARRCSVLVAEADADELAALDARVAHGCSRCQIGSGAGDEVVVISTSAPTTFAVIIAAITATVVITATVIVPTTVVVSATSTVVVASLVVAATTRDRCGVVIGVRVVHQADDA